MPRICRFMQLHSSSWPGTLSYLLTRFLPSSCQNRSYLRFSFGCHKRCSRVLMMGSLPSCSIICPQCIKPRWLATTHLSCNSGQSRNSITSITRSRNPIFLPRCYCKPVNKLPFAICLLLRMLLGSHC